MYTVHCILLQWFLKLGPNWAQLKPTSALPPSPAPCCKAGKYNWKPEVDVEIQEPSLLQTLSLIIVHLALMKVHIDGYNRAEGHKQTHILWLLQQCRLQGSLCKVHTSQFTVHKVHCAQLAECAQFTVHREQSTVHSVHRTLCSWQNVQSEQFTVHTVHREHCTQKTLCTVGRTCTRADPQCSARPSFGLSSSWNGTTTIIITRSWISCSILIALAPTGALYVTVLL